MIAIIHAVYSNEDTTTIQDVSFTMQLPNSWTDQTVNVATGIKVCKIIDVPSTSQQPLFISHSLSIRPNLTWDLFVHGKPVSSETCSALSSASLCICPGSVNAFLKLIDSLSICAGHPDSKFIELAQARKGSFTSAILDTYAPVNLKGETYAQTVRTLSCEVLIPLPSVRCSVCLKYRNTLRYMCSRQKKKMEQSQSPSSSHANNRFLCTPQRNEKMKRLRERATLAETKTKQLTKMLDRLVKDSISVDDDLNSDLANIMDEQTEKVRQECPEDTFRRIFWEEQVAALAKKDKRQIRWHPLMIRWCLNLKLLSSAAYHCVRTSGMVTLPSERTLRDYSNYIQTRSGFQNEVVEQLRGEAKIETLSGPQKHVSVLLDEMTVKESLVYNKFNGKIVGFTDLGNVTNELVEAELKKKCDDSMHPPIANHILALMVRGIFIHLRFPFAHFPTRNLNASQLFPIVWEGIELLEGAGFKVISITADGASPNKKFFKLHGKVSKSKYAYKTNNPFTTEDRSIFFISDVPHLVKTTRNCFSHSFGHGRTRELWVCVISIRNQSEMLSL